MTGQNRGPAHQKSNKNVEQKTCNFILFAFHNFSCDDCHLLFKKLVDKKKDSVKFDSFPKTNEEYITVTYGCIEAIESYRFLSSRLGSLVKTLVNEKRKSMKELKRKLLELME